jgi:hypothetical protein
MTGRMPADLKRAGLQVDRAGVTWEIAQRGFGNGWYTLGTSEGSNPTIALERWLKSGGAIWPGTYGVRSGGRAEEWQPFSVDPSGMVHDRMDSMA